MGAGLLTAAVLGTLLVGFFLFQVFGGGPSEGTRTVVLRRGAGLSEIASTLDREGVIRSAPVFEAWARLTGNGARLRAGEYEVPAGASLASVLDRIASGRVVNHFITVPEGWTSEMAVEALNASPILTGSAPVPLEGAILPQTYQVTRGEDRAAVLNRMMSARDRVLARLWPGRARDLPFSTQQEAITLASIVEKETGVPSERPRVAAVYMNRLRAGIPLQADPTIVYGITRGRPLGRGIRRSELEADTPWNSYRRPGLPPGPIANPGEASIAAVLNPPRSNELFFVANGTGGHSFAATLEEHNRNVVRWRQIEAQRGAQATQGTGVSAPPAPNPTHAQ